MDKDILEKLSELEHEQWCEWSGSISKDLYSLLRILDDNDSLNLSDEDKSLVFNLKMRLENWEALRVPYSDLPEDEKEKDRVYARKIIAVFDEKF